MAGKNTDYFTTLETSQRFDLIRHLIANSEIIPLIRGPSGIGKSLLASRIQQLAPDNWSVCLLEARATMSPEQLLTYIARCSGWADKDIQQDPLQGLVRRFEAMREQGLVPVILVDEAQLLQPTGLITLLRLFERQRAGEPLVSIVLFADEQIDMLLSTPQLRIMSPQSIQVIDLQPLNREEATSFMHFVLQVENLSADLELDSSKLTQLFRETKGVPGLLRQEILNSVGERGVKQASDENSHRRLIYIAMPILILVGGVLFFEDNINQVFKGPESGAAKQPEALNDFKQADRATEQKLDNQGYLESVPPPPVSVEVLKQPIEVPALVLEHGVGDSNEADQQAGPAIEGILADHGAPEALANAIDQTGDIAGSSSEQVAPPESSEEPTLEPEIAPVVLPDREIEEGMQPLEAAVAGVVEEEGALLDQAVLTADPVDPLSGSEWVRTRTPEHYTLQLLGVESLASLKKYVSQHGLKGEIFYIKTLRNGKPWFSLLWGEFPDKLNAINAQQDLPPSVKRAGIWSRSFAELQKLLAQ